MCKDNSISTLNRIGYDLLKYPKSGITPLTIFVQNGNNFNIIAALPNVWISSSRIPEVITKRSPDLDLIESSKLYGSVGVSALIDIFKARVDVSGLKDKAVKLIVNSPKRKYCEFSEVANYIKNGYIKESEAISEFFCDDKKRIFVIYEVLTSSDLRIIISGKNEGDASITAKDISDSLNTNIMAGVSTKKNSEITFNSPEQDVVFGFKHAQIFYNNGWSLDLPEKTGKVTLDGNRIENSILLAPDDRVVFE